MCQSFKILKINTLFVMLLFYLCIILLTKFTFLSIILYYIFFSCVLNLHPNVILLWDQWYSMKISLLTIEYGLFWSSFPSTLEIESAIGWFFINSWRYDMRWVGKIHSDSRMCDMTERYSTISANTYHVISHNFWHICTPYHTLTH